MSFPLALSRREYRAFFHHSPKWHKFIPLSAPSNEAGVTRAGVTAALAKTAIR